MMARSFLCGIFFAFSCFALSSGNSNTTASVNITTEPTSTGTTTTTDSLTTTLTDGVMPITFVPSTTEMNNSTTRAITVPTLILNVTETNPLNTSDNGSEPLTFAPVLLNVTSIIQVLNFTRQEELELKETFVNTSEGGLLLEIIQTNPTFVLGGYNSELDTEPEYVYFYALLLDFYHGLDNDSFVQEFMETVVFGFANATYRLNSERLTSRSCEIYNNAGGNSDFCENMTTSTPVETTSVSVGLIAGCVVAGVVLLILIVIAIIYICKKSKSKVNPRDEFESHSPKSMSRPNSFCTGSVASVRSN